MMSSLTGCLVRGAIAGAAGTTALNATTFLDMAARGRPASSTPQKVIERGAGLLGLSLPEDQDKRQARESGLGSLLGAAAGVSAGMVLGAMCASGHPRRGATTVATAWVLAMLTGNAPMTVLGVTDPRTWRAADWVADIVPHLSYAVVAAGTLKAFEAVR